MYLSPLSWGKTLGGDRAHGLVASSVSLTKMLTAWLIFEAILPFSPTVFSFISSPNCFGFFACKIRPFAHTGNNLRELKERRVALEQSRGEQKDLS